MIIFQNEFTTPEQSRRLLEIGVPADSSNYKIDVSEINGEYIDFPTPVYGRFGRYPKGFYIPCWSIFRLMEIYDLCNEDVDDQYGWAANSGFDYMEYVISRLENGIMNFQRLGR